MVPTCINHSNIKSFNICNVCKNYFCEKCLVEGPEYYYCKSEKCQLELNNILSNKIKSDSLLTQSKKNSVFYELQKSKFPFYVISLFIAILLGLRYSRINQLDIAQTIGYILGASLGLWGIPILLTFLLGIFITVKEARAKIFFYIYSTVWLISAIIMFITLFSIKE